ncbi:hypothetical protein DNTS_003766, partial [Danionella cerebrum]
KKKTDITTESKRRPELPRACHSNPESHKQRWEHQVKEREEEMTGRKREKREREREREQRRKGKKDYNRCRERDAQTATSVIFGYVHMYMRKAEHVKPAEENEAGGKVTSTRLSSSVTEAEKVKQRYFDPASAYRDCWTHTGELLSSERQIVIDEAGIRELSAHSNWQIQGHQSGLAVPRADTVMLDQPEKKIMVLVVVVTSRLSRSRVAGCDEAVLPGTADPWYLDTGQQTVKVVQALIPAADPSGLTWQEHGTG